MRAHASSMQLRGGAPPGRAGAWKQGEPYGANQRAMKGDEGRETRHEGQVQAINQ